MVTAHKMSAENRSDQNYRTNDTEITATTDGTVPVDVSSNVWRLFLDSKCSSATVFFKLHLSAHSYFHSPTPWNPGSNSTLPRKVAKLMDSFRPGSSSYSPFQVQSETDANNNPVTVEQNNANEEIESETPLNLFRPSEISLREADDSLSNFSITTDQDETIHAPSSTDTNSADSISPEEINRRRLYLNLGRPRPFYTVSSTPEVAENKNPAPTLKRKRTVQTLQEEARNKLVSVYGLTNLSNIVKQAELSPKLPQVIRNFLLTFPCQDFEEVGRDRPNKSASYNVRCNLDGQNYTAVFALSEVDKNVSNLWEDEAKWLKLSDPGVSQILAIAVDPLTENIFYIIPERGLGISEVIASCSSEVIELGNGETRDKPDFVNIVGTSVLNTLERLSKAGLSYGPLREENISISHGEVRLENPVMVKSSSPCLDLEQHSSNIGSNLYSLGAILARIFDLDTEEILGYDDQDVQDGCDDQDGIDGHDSHDGYDGQNIHDGHDDCLKLADKKKSLDHSTCKLIKRLLSNPSSFNK